MNMAIYIHRNSEFYHEEMVTFRSYVSLLEGRSVLIFKCLKSGTLWVPSISYRGWVFGSYKVVPAKRDVKTLVYKPYFGIDISTINHSEHHGSIDISIINHSRNYISTDIST